MQKTRQQLGCLSPRKRPKTMQNELRSSFLAPFRADRATAASGIVVSMAVDDLRQKAAAAAHGMSVYVWSAFLAGTRLRAKIAPWAARFGMGPPSHHGVHARGSEGAEIGAGGGHTPSLRVLRFVGAAAPFAAGSSARTPPKPPGVAAQPSRGQLDSNARAASNGVSDALAAQPSWQNLTLDAGRGPTR